VELQLKKFKNIIRCHRSYIVNLENIENISGNLQGYQLNFKQYTEQVPVSRSYTKKIKSAIMISSH
jgi:DNA-binding LytR/AlgR family response regulator